jgi:hypothetical protein
LKEAGRLESGILDPVSLGKKSGEEGESSSGRLFNGNRDVSV